MFPSLALLSQVQQHIFSISNKRKESKRTEHYCCYLLCQKAGLRVSEAINFDPNRKTRKGLYRIKSKGKKRLVYIPKPVINELKQYGWKPNNTNRFNFYNFLKSMKKELGIPSGVELTPHTLRRAFATYHAEAGLPLPLLSKMLGHSSVRTTALYWMNTYHPDDDDDNDTTAILCGKNWLEQHEPDQPDSEIPTISRIPPQSDRIIHLTANSPVLWEINQSLTNALSNCRCQLAEKDQQIARLTNKLAQAIEQNANLWDDLSNLSQQNATLHQELTQATTKQEQIQQDLTTAKETIAKLEQKLANEKAKQIATVNSLAQKKTKQPILKGN